MLFLITAALAGDNDFVASDYSSSEQQVDYEGHIDAPPELVWAALSDHNGMTAWMPKLSHVTVDNSNATTENGVGCERECTFNGSDLTERIVWWEEGVGYGYSVLDGPVSDHVGIVTLEDDGNGGTNIYWDQYFEAKGLKPKMMRKMMPKLLDEAVQNLELQLQSESTTNS
jgi:uncharacterized protein YndB with AHSA1/START domain